MSSLLDVDCTITSLIVLGKGGCQSHGQQKIPQCYDLSLVATLPPPYCHTDLLYLPRELRSSSISAWCCSSKVSIDFGWILGDIPSPMPMSWNWNITLCKALVLTRGPHYSPLPESGPRSAPGSHHRPAPGASADCSQDSSPGQPEQSEEVIVGWQRGWGRGFISIQLLNIE